MTDASRWRVRDAALAMFAGFVVSAFAYALVGVDPSNLLLFGVVIPAQWIGTLGAVAWLSSRRDDWRTALRGSARWEDAVGVLHGAGIQVLLSLVAYLIIVMVLDATAPTQEVVESMADVVGTTERLAVVLGLVVLGPIAEEVVFRGILLRALERRGRRFAIVGSALGFSALHLLDPNAVVAVPFLFVLGVVLARATLHTGRLGRAVAIHAGFNLVTVLALFAS